jgi:hypothetical protein
VISEVYPNPFNPTGRLEVAIRVKQDVDGSIVDALGRHVGAMYNGRMTPGESHLFAVGSSSIASGPYLVLIEGEHFEAVVRRAYLLK